MSCQSPREKRSIALGALTLKAYVITSGAVFGVLTLLHIARAFAEGPRLATDPKFVLFTALAALLCFWACGLLWRSWRS
jgi:hypothetical protein